MKIIGVSVLFLAFGSMPLPAQQGLVASHAPTEMAQKPGVIPPPTPEPSEVDLKKIVLKVNGVAFPEADVRDQMQRLFPFYSIHGGKVPQRYQGEIREKAIQQVVNDELIFQEAKRTSKPLSQAKFQSVIRQAKQRFGSQAAYQSYAHDRYGSVQEFERRLRRATIIAQFQSSNIDMKAKVPEQRVREVYEKDKKSFTRPESAWMQTITISLPPNPSSDQRKLARKRIDEILPEAKTAARSYESFGVLAEKVSEDEYRVIMGDRKWVHLVGLPPEVVKAIEGLKDGAVSGIVESNAGFAIIRINERRPEKQMEFAEVKDKLREELEKGKAKDLVQGLQKRLREGAKVEVL